MILDVLRVEVLVPDAQSLKDKRAVIKSLKERMRGRFNVAVAEVEPNEKWQRAKLGISTVGDERWVVERLLRQVTDWIRASHEVALIQVDAEYL